MSRATVIVFAILIITISVRCLADSLDDPESQLNRIGEPDNLEVDADDTDRSASPQPYAPVNNRLIPGFNTNRVRWVNCYACSDCPKIFPNTTSKFCPYTNDLTKKNKCVVYAEKYNNMDRPLYIRGCATERGSCLDITRAHENANARLVKLVHCFECEGDKCNTNGVYRSLPNLTTAFLVVIITPLLGKYTLS